MASAVETPRLWSATVGALDFAVVLIVEVTVVSNGDCQCIKSTEPIHANSRNTREIPVCTYFLFCMNSITDHLLTKA